MIEARAQVLDVNGGKLLLQAETQSTCNACGVRQGCGTSVLSRWLGRRFTRFTADNTVDARTGDEVIVGIAENTLLGGSVLVYLLPLLAMLIAALIADVVLVEGAAGRDLKIVAAASAGFLAALWAARAWLTHGSRRIAMQPVVLRKAGEIVPDARFHQSGATSSGQT